MTAPDDAVTIWRWHNKNRWRTARGLASDVEYAALPRPAYVAMKAYAETGENVEGVLIEANLDDFEQTPGETVLWLLDRICSAETALFLAANDPDIERSPVGESARAHFKKYPNGIYARARSALAGDAP